jgi:hypothetical protein
MQTDSYCQCLDAVVYWLHCSDDEDITEDGYVGVAVDYSQRMSNHLGRHRRKRNQYKLHSSMKKVGIQNIVSEIVYEGSVENCYVLEKLLRPDSNIGWNTAAGGSDGDGTGKYQSDLYFKLNPRKSIPSFQEYYANLQTDIDECRKLYLSGRDISTKEKQSLSKKLRHLEHGFFCNNFIKFPSISSEIYANADVVYKTWVDNGMPSDRRLGNLLGYKNRPTAIRTLIDNFCKGWIPYEDIRWRNFVNETS